MNTIASFTLNSVYAAEIAVVLSLLGAAALFRSMLSQDRALREQKTLVAQLHAHVAQCAKDQIVFHDQIGSLQEQCASLLARQQMVEKLGSDSQRIDLAMRMLKSGNTDKSMLHELGLSNSEIKLLLRLHSVPAEAYKAPETGGSVVNVTQLDASRKAQSTKPVEKALKDSLSTQGQALARLFATHGPN